MARKNKVLAILAGTTFALVVFTGVANAGAPPSVFETKEACKSAFKKGAYKFYVPKYLGGSKKNPVDGVTRVMEQLELDACVKMDTMAGKKKWVVQPEGSEYRFNKKADGTLEEVPYARHDCGNPVYEILYLIPEPPPSEEKAEAEAPVSDLGPQVGDLCTSIDEASGEVFSGYVSIDAYGDAYCDAVVEVEVESPWLKSLQYGTCIVAGGAVGFYRSGVPGLITGAVAGAGGTYLGRELGGENWGWIGCATGTAAGLIKWGDGGSSLLKGKPVNPPLAGGPVSPPLGFVW